MILRSMWLTARETLEILKRQETYKNNKWKTHPRRQKLAHRSSKLLKSVITVALGLT